MNRQACGATLPRRSSVLTTRRNPRLRALSIGGALLAIGILVWVFRSRRNPSVCPFGQRIWLEFPRPFLRRESLLMLLQPIPGERILEIGPGTGYYTLDVAQQLSSLGQLDVLDIQQEMLDELRQRCTTLGIDNVMEARGVANDLPFPDATFDAVFLVATLGEISDQAGALQELRRVLKADGRLVVGEGQPDPHMVSKASLRAMTDATGFCHDRCRGFPFGYFARFRLLPPSNAVPLIAPPPS